MPTSQRSPSPALEALKAAGVEAEVNAAGNLILKPSSAVTPDLVAIVRKHKPELLTWYADLDVLSQDETQTLIHNYLKHAAAPVTEDDLVRLVDWAADVRVQATMLGLALKGDVAMGWREGAEQPVFWVAPAV